MSRERLAAEQAELLGALLGQRADPPGFDRAQLRVQQQALLDKRRRVVARLRPDLPERLGDRFRPLFGHYAAEHPRAAGSKARADAAEFAGWLARRGELRRRRWFPPRSARGPGRGSVRAWLSAHAAGRWFTGAAALWRSIGR